MRNIFKRKKRYQTIIQHIREMIVAFWNSVVNFINRLSGSYQRRKTISRLQKGDIIFRVGNTPVDDPAQFNELIAQSSQEGRVMLLVRDAGSGRVGYLVVPLQ